MIAAETKTYSDYGNRRLQVRVHVGRRGRLFVTKAMMMLLVCTCVCGAAARRGNGSMGSDGKTHRLERLQECNRVIDRWVRGRRGSGSRWFLGWHWWLCASSPCRARCRRSGRGCR
jgi:hypothetical protein